MAFIHKQLGSDSSFGSDLKELRELRDLTLEQLADITGIHVSVIKALEDEDFKSLKDPAYAERHVRILAKALEVRASFFLIKYRQLLKANQIISPNVMGIKPTVSWRDFFVVPKLVTLAGFLLFVFLAAAYLFWQAYVLQEPPPLNIISPLDGQQLISAQVNVEGDTSPNTIVTVNGQGAVVDRAGHFNLKFDLPRGLTTLTVEARRRYGDPVTKILRVNYERPEIIEQ